jgi:MtN3 and saliva related transmembrane protein
MIQWLCDFATSLWINVGEHLWPANDPYAWISYLGTTMAALCYIPQIRRIRKTQSSKDISFWMFSIWIVGSSTWIMFGIRTEKPPIILNNLLNFIFRSWVLSYKLVVDRKNTKKAQQD